MKCLNCGKPTTGRNNFCKEEICQAKRDERIRENKRRSMKSYMERTRGIIRCIYCNDEMPKGAIYQRRYCDKPECQTAKNIKRNKSVSKSYQKSMVTKGSDYDRIRKEAEAREARNKKKYGRPLKIEGT